MLETYDQELVTALTIEASSDGGFVLRAIITHNPDPEAPDQFEVLQVIEAPDKDALRSAYANLGYDRIATHVLDASGEAIPGDWYDALRAAKRREYYRAKTAGAEGLKKNGDIRRLHEARVEAEKRRLEREAVLSGTTRPEYTVTARADLNAWLLDPGDDDPRLHTLIQRSLRDVEAFEAKYDAWHKALLFEDITNQVRGMGTFVEDMARWQVCRDVITAMQMGLTFEEILILVQDASLTTKSDQRQKAWGSVVDQALRYRAGEMLIRMKELENDEQDRTSSAPVLAFRARRSHLLAERDAARDRAKAARARWANGSTDRKGRS